MIDNLGFIPKIFLKLRKFPSRYFYETYSCKKERKSVPELPVIAMNFLPNLSPKERTRDLPANCPQVTLKFVKIM